MNEKATIYDFARMCNANKGKCVECELYYVRPVGYTCADVLRDKTEKVNETILKWSKEHPVKTRRDKFLEMFPNAEICYEAIDICPSKLGYKKWDCGGKDCIECKRKYWLEEVQRNEN